jgi:hypothetical protein
MKLVEMKLDAKEQKKESDIVMDKPLYPWGLSIDLNDDALDKLGITELPDAGDYYTLTARVCVTSVSARQNADSETKSMSLQIEALALSDEAADDDKDDPSDKLYAK